jgi:4-amino-4-deoxy-L-arabinose transferase-like glycosyltransferase
MARWTLPCCVGLAALLRFLLVAFTGREPRFYDESEYWSIANSIAGGSGYQLFGHYTAYRPPAMPYLLALGIKLFGAHYWLFSFADAAAACLLPILVLWTAMYLVSEAQARAAAVIVAFHPGLNYAATTIYPTILTAVALVLAALLTLKAIDRNSAALGGLAGMAAGIAAAASTVFVPYGVLLALAAAIRKSLRVACVVAAMSLLPTGIWIARNHLVVHTNAVATNGGFNMELGANDQAEPRSGNLIRPDITPEESFGDEVVWDRDHHARARAWILSHRARYAVLFIERALAVLDSVGKPATPGLHNSLGAELAGWLMLPVILLSLVGLWIFRRRPLAWVTLGALGLVMVSSGLTIVKPRFRFPCDPLLIIFSVAAIGSGSRVFSLPRKARVALEVA